MGEIGLPAASARLLLRAEELARQGRLPEAVRAYEELLRGHPDLPDCWYNLARAQRQMGQFASALGSYQQALERGVRAPEEVHLNRAVILSDCLHQESAAEHELGLALQCNPAYVPAWQNLANLQTDLGRRAEAAVTYRQLLALEPRAYEALARYAYLASTGRPEDPLPEQLRLALADPGASMAERASLGFALGYALDLSGQYREAFVAATAANRASRESAGGVRYDRKACEDFIDEIIAAFPHPRRLAAAPAGEPQPIFICGMYRSGSTLTERLLTGHPRIASGGELDLLPRTVAAALQPFPRTLAGVPDARLAQLAQAYLDQIAALFPGAARVTDKRLDNFLYVGLIRTLFPAARIVHTVRDPLDTCLSIFFLHLDQRLPWSLDLMDTGHYLLQYRRLMAHWQALYGKSILDFSYDMLVHEPRAALERLLLFCGLSFEEACLDPARPGGSVRTASAWQVRGPIHQHSLGRSRHYRQELADLGAYLSGT